MMIIFLNYCLLLFSYYYHQYHFHNPHHPHHLHPCQVACVLCWFSSSNCLFSPSPLPAISDGFIKFCGNFTGLEQNVSCTSIGVAQIAQDIVELMFFVRFHFNGVISHGSAFSTHFSEDIQIVHVASWWTQTSCNLATSLLWSSVLIVSYCSWL